MRCANRCSPRPGARAGAHVMPEAPAASPLSRRRREAALLPGPAAVLGRTVFSVVSTLLCLALVSVSAVPATAVETMGARPGSHEADLGTWAGPDAGYALPHARSPTTTGEVFEAARSGSRAETMDGSFDLAQADASEDQGAAHDGSVRVSPDTLEWTVRPQIGHSDAVTHVVFSPDGRTLLSAGDASSLHLWDVETGRILWDGLTPYANVANLLYSLDGRSAIARTISNDGFEYPGVAVWDVESGETAPGNRSWESSVHGLSRISFSADGRIFVSADRYEVKIWEIATDRVLSSISETTAGANYIERVELSPDGRILVTYYFDDTIRLWQTKTGTLLLPEHEIVPPDSRPVASSGRHNVNVGNDGTAWLWDAFTGKLLHHLRGHTGNIIAATFSADGRTVATVSDDGIARVWDIASGKEVQILEGNSAEVSSVALSANGRMLATGSHDGKAMLLNLDTGRTVSFLPTESYDPIAAVTLSDDGSTLLTTTSEHFHVVWDTKSGDNLLSGSAEYLVLSPDGQLIVYAFSPEELRVYQTRDPRELLQIMGHSGAIYYAVFSDDSRMIATASYDDTARVWEVATGRELLVLDGYGHSHAEMGIVIGPNGSTIATGSRDGKIRLWDSATGEQKRVLETSHRPEWVHFSHEGRAVVTGSEEVSQTWDLETGSEIKQFKRRNGSILSVILSSDGSTTAFEDTHNNVHVWSASSVGRTLVQQDSATRMERFWISEEGRYVAATLEDGAAELWDTSAGGVEGVLLEGHSSRINVVAFGVARNLLATGSEDGTARLWDLHSGREYLVMRGHTSGIVGIQFSIDGNILSTSSQDARAKWWDTETGQELYSRDQVLVNEGAVEFSPDGRTTIVKLSDTLVSLLDTRTFEEIGVLDGVSTDIAFSADGHGGAAGLSDGTVAFWSSESSQGLQRRGGSVVAQLSAGFSPDGRILVTRSKMGRVMIWDTSVGESPFALDMLSDDGAVSFDTNSHAMALSSGGTSTALWNIDTGHKIRTLEGKMLLSGKHINDQIITIADFGKVVVSDAATGEKVREFELHSKSPEAVQVSPDLRILAEMDSDKSDANLGD